MYRRTLAIAFALISPAVRGARPSVGLATAADEDAAPNRGDIPFVSQEVATPMKFLESIPDAVLERSPEELIGAMIMATAIAAVMAALYAFNRRKATPSPTFVGGLALAASLACMAIVIGHLGSSGGDLMTTPDGVRPGMRRGRTAGPSWPLMPAPWGFYGPGRSSGFHIVFAADADHDGRLTAAEMDLLLKEADADGDGSIDSRDVDRLIASRPHLPSQWPGAAARGRDRVEVGRPHDSGVPDKLADEARFVGPLPE